eukprot:97242-Chlamydomonas_euryale.AAC.2
MCIRDRSGKGEDARLLSADGTRQCGDRGACGATGMCVRGGRGEDAFRVCAGGRQLGRPQVAVSEVGTVTCGSVVRGGQRE